MTAYISTAKVNTFDGDFQQTFNFTKGLNILSGENGTGKSTVLGLIQQHYNRQQTPCIVSCKSRTTDEIVEANQLKIAMFNPKRNAIKREANQIFNEILRRGSNMQNLSSKIQQVLKDDAVYEYPSVGEIFMEYFLEKKKPGKKTEPEYAAEIISEFNDEIRNIINDLALHIDTNNWSGSPNLMYHQHNKNMRIDQLSCGQKECLSLIFNLFVNRDNHHVFIIDEPEIHLNWNLEKSFFNYLKNFSEKYDKQIIVATHSRIIFNDEFSSLTKFLVWNDNGKLEARDNLPMETKIKIAGEFAETYNVLGFTKELTFFVEDKIHAHVVKNIGNCLIGKEPIVVKSGNKGGVINHFRNFLESDPKISSNSYFIVDNDNIENFEKEHQHLIYLNKHSIESYLLNLDILQKLFCMKESELKQQIYNIALKHSSDCLEVKKLPKRFTELLFSKIGHDDFVNHDLFEVISCKEILRELLKENAPYKNIKNKKQRMQQYIKDYIEKAGVENLQKIFDDKLISAFSSEETT